MLRINSDYRLKRFPYWLRRSIKFDAAIERTKEVLKDLGVNTVCHYSRCPNLHDCFSKMKCTFLILGSHCTRSCSFCAIDTATVRDLEPPEAKEIGALRDAVRILEIREVIITSVTRDDLRDGGASYFAECIEVLRRSNAGLSIEVLVPDFRGDKDLIETVARAGPDIFSHNVETVPRLYKKVRPGAEYERSLGVLSCAKRSGNGFLVKSGLMVGMGERAKEVFSVMRDLKGAGCDIVTIGQYLKPEPSCLDVEEFIEPAQFELFSKEALKLGFERFSCSPFTRSSQMSVSC